MAKYIHFTEDEKETARETDLASFLIRRGERLKKSGSEYEWDGHHITVRGNQFYDQYRAEGGTAIDFVRREYRLSFKDAMLLLLEENGIVKSDAPSLPKAPPLQIREKQVKVKPDVPEPKPFSLPQANENMRRVYAYLIKSRGIDPSVITYFAKERLLYEDAKHHNAVFVGKDEDGVPRHAHKKSVYTEGDDFRGNETGSDGRYSFHYIGTSDTIYAFEAPIDMLSFISLYPENWMDHSYVALCSVSDMALFHQIEVNKNITKAVLGLDRDKAGTLAMSKIVEKLIANGFADEDISVASMSKDWNDDLGLIRKLETLGLNQSEIGGASWMVSLT